MNDQEPTKLSKPTPLMVINNIIRVTKSVDITSNIVDDITTDEQLHDLLLANLPPSKSLCLFGLTPTDTIPTGCEL